MKCEYVVLEVWMWWRLDSTNVVDPIITAITSIWMDHSEFLWGTLDKISAEKAGIIKTWVPVVVNHENEVIKGIATERKSPVIFSRKRHETNLLGEHQERNAGIAYEIGKYLWIAEANILQGLREVEHIFRLQFISDNVLIDGAHNADALKELKKYVDSISHKFSNIHLCFALKKWKLYSLVTDIFWVNANYVLIDSKSQIVETVENLHKEMQESHHIVEVLTPEDIIARSCENKRELFVVFGSLYIMSGFKI